MAAFQGREGGKVCISLIGTGTIIGRYLLTSFKFIKTIKFNRHALLEQTKLAFYSGNVHFLLVAVVMVEGGRRGTEWRGC